MAKLVVAIEPSLGAADARLVAWFSHTGNVTVEGDQEV